MPSIESFQDKVGLPKVYFVLYEFFFRPAMMDEEKWKHNCLNDTAEFGPTTTEAQVHTNIADHYFAWLFECQHKASDVEIWKNKNVLSDYDLTRYEKEHKIGIPSVCDLVLPNVEIEFSTESSNYVIVRKIVREDYNDKYVKIDMSVTDTTTGEPKVEDCLKADYERMKKERCEKQRKIADDAIANKGRLEMMTAVGSKLKKFYDRKEKYRDKYQKAVEKPENENTLRKLKEAIGTKETNKKRKEMDLLKTLTGSVEDKENSSPDQKETPTKKRKVVDGFTNETADFFCSMAESLATEVENTKDQPRKKWDDCYRMLWKIRQEEMEMTKPKQKERRSKVMNVRRIVSL